MLKKHVSAIGNSILSSNLISISVIPDGNVLVPVQKLQISTRLGPSEKNEKSYFFFHSTLQKLYVLLDLKEWIRDGKKKR